MTEALAENHRALSIKEPRASSISGSKRYGRLPKAVVAFAGTRDAYQVPLALAEAGLLESLVTDRYFPPPLSLLLNVFGRSELSGCEIAASKVTVSWSALRHFVAEKLGRRTAGGWEKGAAIGKAASRIARNRRAAIFSYSTYAFEALKDSEARCKVLFQFHPHPRSVRQILLEELELVPWTAPSLHDEPELALSEDKFELLCNESTMAEGIVVASRFTAETLIANGVAAHKIHTVPYGIDTGVFRSRIRHNTPATPLRIAFVGNLEQRKGVSYLLEAIRRCDPRFVRLVVCNRFRPRSIWHDRTPPNCEFHIGLNRTKLIEVLSSCDLLALPSLVEGFGHVILESMSLGMPVVATANTGAPDVVRDGVDGFIVPIRDASAIANRFEWALENFKTLQDMGTAASRRSLQFSWESFRAGIRMAYEQIVAARDLDDGN